MQLSTLTPGQQIQENFAVVKVEEKRSANGMPYRVVELSQSTGMINGKIWQDSFTTAPLQAGKVYMITAQVDNYRGIVGLVISQAFDTQEDFDAYISSRPTLIFDIETVGKKFEDLDEWDQHYFLKTLERMEEDEKVAKQKTGLHPLYGFVVSIGMYNPNSQKGMVYLIGDVECTPENPSFIYKIFPDEKSLLEAFWELALKYERFVTFNGYRFDFPFLALRSAINRIKVPLELNSRQDMYVDLMMKFRGTANYKLEALCRCFGITNPKQQGVSGLLVSELYKEGKIQDICDYVARDVVSTGELYLIWKKYMAGRIIL